MTSGQEQLVMSRALEVAKALSPDGITIDLVEIAARKNAGFPLNDQNLGYQLYCGDAVWAPSPTAHVHGAFQFIVTLRATSQSSNAVTDFGTLVARYQVAYQLEAPVSRFSDDALESFVGLYGFIHLWPYARAEFLQLSSKIGLPPLTLPSLKTGVLPETFSISKLDVDEHAKATRS